MSQNVFHVGLRIVKTAVAVFFSILITKLFQGEPFYAVIAAVICMKQTSKDSRHTGFERVIGTVFGGLFGMGMLYFLKVSPIKFYGTSYDLLLCLGLMVVIKVLILMKRDDAVSIACVVYLSLMVVPMGEQAIMPYAVGRVLETLLGVVVAVLVNHLLPNHYISKEA